MTQPHLQIHLKSFRWRKAKWMPRILATPPPEPTQQAARILSIQRNIILPARAMVTAFVCFYLFPTPTGSEGYREVLLETLEGYFIFYIIINAFAAVLLTLRRFPFRLVQWVVFAVGLMDGLLLLGLTAWTQGFQSTLFWVFPGLIIINALSIPLATPQIVLNLALSAFYLGAGLVNIKVNEGESAQQAVVPHHTNTAMLLSGDIVNFASLAAKLKNPALDDGVSVYLKSQLSVEIQTLLSNYNGGSDLVLKHALAEDLNRIIQSGPIFDETRFAHTRLSAQTSKLLGQKPKGSDLTRLNRALLSDAYPQEIKNRVMKEKGFMRSQATPEPPGEEGGPEPFLLRLSILLLMTVSCYGIQVLSSLQKTAEEEVQKSAARNDELKAAGRLAAEIAHQLKNPLGIINNAIFSLQRGLKEGRNDFTQQFEIIREEIDKSDRILTQLMGYGQLSEGRVEKLNVPAELDRAIAEVLPAGTSYATQAQRNYDANLPEMLMQRSHLSAVLVNLLQNAREALAGHGNIFVQAHCRNGNSVEIVVADDGPGITADKLDKIFEAYVTTKERGTGLGLAIVKHNVELYGGSVRAESELGKGARFILSFPAKTLIMKGP
jgi:signal transduction histidine kinase